MKHFAGFGLDIGNQCLLNNGVPINMAPKPFAVLRYLVENPGRLITHDELLDALWPETYVQPQVLRTYMLELRKVLGDDAGQPRFIQTVPKRGYRFLAAVSENLPAVQAPAPPLHVPPGIVGRDKELTLLHTQIQELAAGQRRVVFVTGEAGIGKTALVDAFCRQLDAPAAIVARGQCVQGLGVAEAYYPITEALSQLCAGPDGDAACRVLARVAPSWLVHDRKGEAAPERAPGELCAALEEISRDKPLLLVTEDLQWADECTLHLLSALARRRAPARLILVITIGVRRGESDGPVLTLKQDLLLRRLASELHLAPLSKSAVASLLRRELSQDALPPGLTDFVYRRSEGNPLFVTAVLDHLIAQQILVRGGEEAAWKQSESFPHTDAAVPEALSQMIELEIERLGPDEQRLLEAASLMSVAFPAWAVAAALSKDSAEVEEACDALARRLHFVVRAGSDELPDGSVSTFYVFAHGLYREVLYRRQSSSRRARRHIRIAERLGELFAGREADVARERALHYEAAGDLNRAERMLLSATSVC